MVTEDEARKNQDATIRDLLATLRQSGLLYHPGLGSDEEPPTQSMGSRPRKPGPTRPPRGAAATPPTTEKPTDAPEPQTTRRRPATAGSR